MVAQCSALLGDLPQSCCPLVKPGTLAGVADQTIYKGELQTVYDQGHFSALEKFH